jgi:hypothetical protein
VALLFDCAAGLVVESFRKTRIPAHASVVIGTSRNATRQQKITELWCRSVEYYNAIAW